MKVGQKKNSKKTPSANALKQQRFRERQKAQGKKLVRGYITPQAMRCYKEISDVTNWNDSETLSNALRLTYAAYKCGQIGLLTKWLKDHEPSEEQEAKQQMEAQPQVEASNEERIKKAS